MGGAYQSLGRLSEALVALNTAISLDASFGGSYLNRANVLSRLGRHEEALADYQRALDVEPSDSNIAWTATWAHFGPGGITPAQVMELERISSLDPTHYTSHCCLAVLAYSHADPQRALQHLEQAIWLAPHDWDPRFWIGLLAVLMDEQEMARQAIEHALELGLPPLLLTPLLWLKKVHVDFFERHARNFFTEYGIALPE